MRLKPPELCCLQACSAGWSHTQSVWTWELITRAYEFSKVAHAGQTRLSGEPYVNHCIEVAEIIGELGLDTVTLACGLIHDVVEDTPATLGDVRDAFGPAVATVVDGLTKIGRVQFRTNTEQQVENYRKLLLSMAQDARVILVKLADRLHNMRTLEHLPAKSAAESRWRRGKSMLPWRTAWGWRR